MAHRYHETILIRRAPDPMVNGQMARRAHMANGVAGAPAAFNWRGVWYQVDEVLSAWRLRDRWWAEPLADVANRANSAHAGMPPTDALPPTERVYYRVLCRDPEGEQVFDLYYDAASGQWMLDRVHD